MTTLNSEWLKVAFMSIEMRSEVPKVEECNDLTNS